MDYRQYISGNPNIMLGKPCITGTRITVELVLKRLSEGCSVEEIMVMFPHVTREGVLAVLAYAADMVKNEESLSMVS